MDAVFQFEGNGSQAFRAINNSTIAERLGVPHAQRGGLGRFLHQGVGIMSYTSLEAQPLAYVVTATAGGYELRAEWAVSGAKANVVVEFLALLRRCEQPEPGTTPWRRTVAEKLSGLLAESERLNVAYEPGGGRAGRLTLEARVTAEALEAVAAARDIDLASEPPAQPLPPRQVPYELVAGVIGENLAAARALYGRDHAALLAVALPLTGYELMADVLVGFTYYLYLQQPQRAYPFLRRAADQADRLEKRLARYVLDFVGNIEFGELRWPGAAEHSLVQSMALGNDYALLKLAYLYLQQASAPHRQQAYLLARHGEMLLRVAPDDYDQDDPSADEGPAPHTPDQRRAGYHIVASVYLWNRDVEGAARAQQHFLADGDWCRLHRDLVQGYLLLAFALSDEAFLTDLIADYPVVRQEFGLLLGAWHYSVLEPEAEGFTVQMVPLVNQLNGARRRYFG